MNVIERSHEDGDDDAGEHGAAGDKSLPDAVAASRVPTAALLASDPAPEVRIAAANRCGDLKVLAAAWENEPDAAVRAAFASV